MNRATRTLWWRVWVAGGVAGVMAAASTAALAQASVRGAGAFGPDAGIAINGLRFGRSAGLETLPAPTLEVPRREPLAGQVSRLEVLTPDTANGATAAGPRATRVRAVKSEDAEAVPHKSAEADDAESAKPVARQTVAQAKRVAVCR